MTTPKAQNFCVWANLSFAKGQKTATVTVKAPWVSATSVIVPVIDDASKVLVAALTAQMQLAATNKVPGVGFDVLAVCKSDFSGDLGVICLGT